MTFSCFFKKLFSTSYWRHRQLCGGDRLFRSWNCSFNWPSSFFSISCM